MHEDMTQKDREDDMVGYLNQSLYGTRDAAAIYQKEVMKFMFKEGEWVVEHQAEFLTGRSE